MMNRHTRIESTVREACDPLYLEVVDETHMHSVPPGSESHFKVLVVSERFAGQSLLARQRNLNRLLGGELKNGLHALSLHAWTPEEWFDKGGALPESPPCLGGSKVKVEASG